MAELKISANHERERRTLGGWPMLATVILIIIAGLVLVIAAAILMVSNLMVVLCGESEVHPVVNTGTLYA